MKTVKDFSVITLATGVVALAVYFFLLPSHTSVGSIVGLAVILEQLLPLRMSCSSCWGFC